MSEIDWSHVEDLAEVAYRADHTIISGYDYGRGFQAGYLAGRASLTDEAATPYTEQETTNG
jgi:hypothetical protein